MHPYQAESDVELNLTVGDYVVVRKVTNKVDLFKVVCLDSLQTSLIDHVLHWFFQQVSNNGWAEGECKGKAGWFPFGYIERRERVLASKVAEVF